jgi:hypothetical protein
VTTPFAASTRTAARWALLLVIPAVLTLPGCFLAAAGAGAGGAIYLTSRGAESIVDASVSQVAAAVDDTFQEMGIPVSGTNTEKGGDEREVSGKQGDLDVTVHFQRQTPSSTKVEVTARKNVAEWDKDYARKVLEKIVAKS